jgi:tetratricopeptide (TPR) repeat protein
MMSHVVDFAHGLRANLMDHMAEFAASTELGFDRPSMRFPPTSWTSYCVERSTLGMGVHCPFDTDELVVASEPLFSAAECCAIKEEAATLIAEGRGSTFTMTDTNKDCAVHEMPRTLRWLNEGALARITSLAATCFPSAVSDPTQLWVYRGLVIKYDASAGLTHQPVHRDGALISCVVPLSERAEYAGGGTYIEQLGRALVLEQGQALLHPSSVRHSGHRITSGERWVLVLFLNSVAMPYGEHVRRFRARAQEAFAECQGLEEADAEMGDGAAEEVEDGQGEVDEADEADEGIDDVEDEELQCLHHALAVSGESDHEVWYDLGARAHELGDVAEALRCYERATALCPTDALLLGNMGVALLELSRPRDALRCYRRALAVDKYDINARFNAGELMLSTGRLRGLAAVLASAPEVTMRDEGMQMLAEELAKATQHQKKEAKKNKKRGKGQPS